MIRSLMAVFLLAASAVAGAQEWRPVPAAGKFNVSGMALLQQQDARISFLVVQDNKGDDEDRAGIVTVERDGAPEYESLAWPGDQKLPFDLESVTQVPGAEGEFLAAESSGKVYHLKAQQKGTTVSLEIVRTFSLPESSKRRITRAWAFSGSGQSF